MARAPYPGLRPFEREDADVFFGRERHVDAMVDRLAHRRFLAVTGSSGSGKSSLVRAGLLEALEAGLLAKAGPLWRFAILRPGDHPMSALAAALIEAEGGACQPDDIALRRAALERGPLALVEDLHKRPLPEGGNLLILIDQFEELFRYRGLAGREEAEAFVDLLLASVDASDMPIYAVLTMRSDFFGECSQFDGLAEAVCDSLFLCPRLTRGHVVDAVGLPARVFGGRVEPQLVARVVNDMGTDPDQLPLMQHAMMRLWDQAQAGGETPPVLRLDDYLAADGLKGSLSRHADEIVEVLARDAPQRRELVRRMFCLLTGWVDDRTVRRLAPVSEVMEVTGQPLEEIATIADAFRATGANLLLPPPAERLTPQTIIDISHEALIRQWQTLTDWLAEEREFMVWRGHVERDAADNGDPLTGQRLAVARGWYERRSAAMPPVLRTFIANSIAADDRRIAAERRRRRTIFGATALGLVVALVLVGFTTWQRNIAEQERAEAQTQRAKAERSLEVAGQTLSGVIFNIVLKYWDSGLPRTVTHKILDEALRQLDQLGKDPDLPSDLLYTKSLALEGSSEALLSLGDSDLALIEARRSIEVADILVARVPDKLLYQLALSISTGEVGDVLAAQGKAGEALVVYRRSLSIMQILATKQPDNTEWQSDLLDRYYRIGDALKSMGQLDEALAAYHQALDVANALVKQVPTNLTWQRDLSLTDDRIAGLLDEQGRYDEAMALFKASLKIRRMLVQKDPDNSAWQSDLSFSDEKVADILKRQGDLKGAGALYNESLAIRQLLVKKDPSETVWQYSLAVSYERIGDLHRAQADYSDALTAYRQGLAIAKALTDKDPNISEWQREVWIEDYRVGGILEMQKDLPTALNYYRDALAVLGRLANRNPKDTQRRGDLIYGLRRNAHAELEAGNAAQALADQRRVVTLDREIYQAKPTDDAKAALVGALGSVSYYSLINRQWQPALDAADDALKLDPSELWIETNKAHALLFLGRIDEAKAIYLADKDKLIGKQTFGEAVRDDFTTFRKFGIDTPEMKQIEALLG